MKGYNILSLTENTPQRALQYSILCLLGAKRLEEKECLAELVSGHAWSSIIAVSSAESAWQDFRFACLLLVVFHCSDILPYNGSEWDGMSDYLLAE